MNWRLWSRWQENDAVELVAREAWESIELLRMGGNFVPRVELAGLRRSLACARAFARAHSGEDALRVLPVRVQAAARIRLQELTGRCGLIVGRADLLTLATIAEAAAQGWAITVEDGAFARGHLGGFLPPGGSMLCPLSQMPARFLGLHEGNGERGLFFTFCDRPLNTYDGTILVQSDLGAFHLSEADALLAELPFDSILPQPALPVSFIDEAPGDVRARRTGDFLRELSAEISRHPGEYLGWKKLGSRSQGFQRKVTGNGRAILKSLVLCAKISGHCRDEAACADVMQAIGRLPKMP